MPEIVRNGRTIWIRNENDASVYDLYHCEDGVVEEEIKLLKPDRNRYTTEFGCPDSHGRISSANGEQKANPLWLTKYIPLSKPFKPSLYFTK